MFKGNRNNLFLFWIIVIGVVLFFKIFIDGYILMIIEVNGYRVKGINVELVIFNFGERIVFKINKLDFRIYNFWIWVIMVDVINSIEVRVILCYDENEVVELKISLIICLFKKLCKVFNCFFGLFFVKEYMECIIVDKVDFFELMEL